MAFNNQKQERLQHVDLSRKGSIDEHILEAVGFINSQPSYFTTSSCSGRIIILESRDCHDSPDSPASSAIISKSAPNKVAKKGCKWLLVSHEKINMEAVEEALLKVSNEAVFKFEPMIMHIQCQSIPDAQALHQAAVSAGFRNSGISIGGKGKIIVAVRSTHGLEAPLSADGVVLVSKQYLNFLVDCANEKMDENFSRINRFMEELRVLVKKQSCACDDPDSQKGKRKHKTRKSPTAFDSRVKDGEERGVHDKKVLENDDEDLSLFVFENT